MKNKIQKYILITVASFLQIYAICQTTTLGNNSVNPTDYLGWNVFSTNDLNIRHFRSDQSILFYTNNTERMRIHRDGQLSLGTPSILGNAKLTVFQNNGTMGIRGLSIDQSSPIFSPNFDCRLVNENSTHIAAVNFRIKAIASQDA